MQVSKLLSKNQFDGYIKNIFRSRKQNSIHSKYRDRTFYDRTAGVAFWLLLLSFGCNIFSAYSEHFYIKQFISDSITHEGLVSALVIGLILIIELIKRNSIPKVFQYYFKYGEIDKVSLSMVIVFCAISIFSSFMGAKLIPSQLAPAPTLVSIDSVNGYYDAQMASINNSIKKQENTTWNGNITAQANKNITSLNRQKSDLIKQREKSGKEAKIQNDETMANHQSSIEQQGANIGWATLISECLLLLIIGFNEYRDFTLYALQEKEGISFPSPISYLLTQETANKQNQPRQQEAKRNPIGFDRNRAHDNRNSDNNDNRNPSHDNREGENPHLRNCIECNKEYTYKHVKQKYCSDNCRAIYNKKKRKK